MSDFYAGLSMPGPSSVTSTTERQFLLGPPYWFLLKGIVVKGSAASDAGNTPTTELRAGILMGKVTADGLYAHYQPNGTDGTQVAEGALWDPRRTTDTDGNTVNRPAQLVIAGYVKASQLLLLDQQARAQLYGRFTFDDDPAGNPFGWKQALAKATDYTVVSATDNNTLFTTTGAVGAVTFTLPAVASTIKGQKFRFINTVNQTMTIAAPANKLVATNSATATSVAFSTAGQKIGAVVEVMADETGAKWVASILCPNAVTVA